MALSNHAVPALVSVGPNKMKQRIFVVEDHPLMRKSIVAALERESDLAVCGQADDAPDALTAIVSLHPDLVLTDLELKTSSGLDLIKALRARDAALPIVAVTLFSHGERARLARAAGASAFMPKHHGPEWLVAITRALLRPPARPDRTVKRHTGPTTRKPDPHHGKQLL